MTQQRAAGQKGRNAAKALVLTLALFGALLSMIGSEAHSIAALLGRGGVKKTKVLLRAKGYELLLHRGKGKVPIPSLQLRKTPLKPLSLAAGGSVEGAMSTGDLLGFPFTTQNAAVLQIGLPRISGRFRVSVEDPASADAEEAQGVTELSYQQDSGVGEFGGKLRSNGEWSASFAREVEDVGYVRGTFNSQLDWSLDLDTSYPAVKGIAPSVSYGATQDGMRVHATLDGDLKKNVHGSYSLRNIPGKYAPLDFIHQAKVKVSSANSRHVVEAVGDYDRKLVKIPVRGSLTYGLKTRPGTLEASVDFDRYRLRARTSRAQVMAAIARTPNESGQRPAEIELKAGKVSAMARLDPGSNQPRRVRFNMDV